MSKVISKDGTIIAFDQSGTGLVVIPVAGALGMRSHPIMAGLAERLAPLLKTAPILPACWKRRRNR